MKETLIKRYRWTMKCLKRVEYFHIGEEPRKLGYFLENLFIRWAKKSFVLAAMPAHEERSLYQSSRNPDVVSIPILDERRSTRARENIFWKLKQFHIVLTLLTVYYIVVGNRNKKKNIPLKYPWICKNLYISFNILKKREERFLYFFYFFF